MTDELDRDEEARRLIESALGPERQALPWWRDSETGGIYMSFPVLDDDAAPTDRREALLVEVVEDDPGKPYVIVRYPGPNGREVRLPRDMEVEPQ
jgi:hypothetical protein